MNLALDRALLAFATAVLLMCIAGPAQPLASQQFRAVVVHGETKPFVIVGDESAAMCLWFYTYNFYSDLEEQVPQPSAPTVTLSFLTSEEWEAVGNRGGSSIPLTALTKARFHTRIYLPASHEQPHLQFKKPTGAWTSRMRLHTAAEPYLAKHGIPTRRDAAGMAAIREFLPEELDAARAVYRSNSLSNGCSEI